MDCDRRLHRTAEVVSCCPVEDPGPFYTPSLAAKEGTPRARSH